MKKALLIALSSLALQACGTLDFKPQEYPLRAGLIPSLSVSGTVAVANAQPSTDQAIVYSYGGTKLASNLNAITEVMVKQTLKEIDKNGQKTGATSAKSIDLKVLSLVSEYSNMFFWRSKLHFQAKLGNGVVIDATVPHTSGDVHQDLNGCIAESVMILLKDERVRSYLAQ